MKNLTAHGKKFAVKYIDDYSKGKISFSEAKALLNCCFNDVETE